jgi:hypothetical protein
MGTAATAARCRLKIGKPRGVSVVAAYPLYPTAIQTIDAARDLASQARSSFSNRPLAAKAAYTVIGFGLGQFVGEPADGFGGIDAGVMTALDLSDESAAAELDGLAASLEQSVGESPDALAGPITGIVTAALIRWAAKLAWRLILG